MKFQPDTLAGVNHITHVDAQGLRANGAPWTGSVVVPWTGDVRAWTADGEAAALATLSSAHFDGLLDLAPEVVIFGSGARLRFVSPALYRGLIERRIGIETMDCAAACRTYTVLANEGRRVVAAVLFDAA